MYGTITQISITPDQLTELVRVAVRSELANYTPPAPGSIVKYKSLQPDGTYKNRLFLIIKQMPGYGDLLVCRISSRLRQEIRGFDEVLIPDANNGLTTTSLIRLGLLSVIQPQMVVGVIGKIPDALHQHLLCRLAGYLTAF